MTAPCKNCEDRYFACHSQCRDYIDFRGKRDKALEDKQIVMNDRKAEVDRVMKIRKYKRWQS